MEEEAENLNSYLSGEFGDALAFTYVDVKSNEMKNHPGIAKIMGIARLPLIGLNGKSRFHGGIFREAIKDAVNF